MLNLDTHVLLHALDGRLEPEERQLLAADGDWGISAIVLWEIEKLYQKGRILHGLDYTPLALAVQRLEIWPITADVCRNLRVLDGAPASVPRSGTGNIVSGRMIVAYALRGCSTVQLHTFFQLPLSEFTAARNALATRLKKAGAPEDAA